VLIKLKIKKQLNSIYLCVKSKFKKIDHFAKNPKKRGKPANENKIKIIIIVISLFLFNKRFN